MRRKKKKSAKKKWVTGEYTSTLTGKTYSYRSSWELRYMKELDKNPRIKKWEYESIKIPYAFKKRYRNYIPDFIITYHSGRTALVEVKPKQLTETKMNKAKEVTARNYCKKRGWIYRIKSYND